MNVSARLRHTRADAYTKRHLYKIIKFEQHRVSHVREV